VNILLNHIKELNLCGERRPSLEQLQRHIESLIPQASNPKSLLTMAHQPITEAPILRSGLFAIPPPMDQPLAYAVVVFLFLLAVYSTGQKKADVPELNPPKSRLRLPGIVSAEQTENFIRHGQELIKAGRAKFPDQPYRLYSYLGDSVIIPPRFINDIRNEKALDFRIAFKKVSRSTGTPIC
jgi:hypothetical protein